MEPGEHRAATPGTTPAATPGTTPAATPGTVSNSTVKRAAVWVVGVLVAAILGFFVTFGAGRLEALISGEQPLGVVPVPTHSKVGGVGPAQPGINSDDLHGFQILVSNPNRLPKNIAQIDDCSKLKSAGIAAGGIDISSSEKNAEPPDTNINLTGSASDGLTIVGMRARITRRTPTPDGVLLYCPPEPTFGAPAPT